MYTRDTSKSAITSHGNNAHEDCRRLLANNGFEVVFVYSDLGSHVQSRHMPRHFQFGYPQQVRHLLSLINTLYHDKECEVVLFFRRDMYSGGLASIAGVVRNLIPKRDVTVHEPEFAYFNMVDEPAIDSERYEIFLYNKAFLKITLNMSHECRRTISFKTPNNNILCAISYMQDTFVFISSARTIYFSNKTLINELL